jgi:hypothetical protein
MARPCLFIGSSRELLPVARTIQQKLSECADTTIWDKYNFPLGQPVLDGLLMAAEQFDFALFVFGQDDTLIIRDVTTKVVRENVLFELGLFIGRMGRGRAVWISPVGVAAPYTISDLEGIIHLSFDDTSAERDESLNDAIRKVCWQITDLGPRSDRAVEDVTNRRTLCVASAQYSEKRFEADITYIHNFFSPGEVTTAHGLSAKAFEDHFSPGKQWDIVHLGVYVDKANTRMLFDPQPGVEARGSLRIEAIEDMVKSSSARLVIIITCDSLAFGARLARFTNVIAGHQPIAAVEAIDWAKVFYEHLAAGTPLSAAFSTAQRRADPGLILLTHKDVRFPPTGTSKCQTGPSRNLSRR